MHAVTSSPAALALRSNASSARLSRVARAPARAHARCRRVTAIMDAADASSAEMGSSAALDSMDADDENEAAAEKMARDVAIELAVIADETRAADVRVLGVSKKVHWARYFLLATAFNRPQMRAVAEKVREHLNETYGTQIAKSVSQNSDWVCVDAADIIVHVFTPSSRQFYDIETLYKDAVDVELPFETERPISQEEEDEFEVF